MKLRKALLAMSVLNVLALVWAACYLPPIVRLYVNVVPFFNFLLTRWLVPVLGLLPTLMLVCMRRYFQAVDRQGGSPCLLYTSCAARRCSTTPRWRTPARWG